MQGKIAVEEHFTIPGATGSANRYVSPYWSELPGKLLDMHDRRLKEMDAAGIGLAIVSLNSNAVQGVLEPAVAIELARRANDALAAEIAKRPDRFAGLAALPMQDPDAAVRELRRSVGELKFKGALVNSFSQVGTADTAVYYDLPQYEPFWAEVERLGVPFYLHPRDPLPSRRQAYEGHPWLVGSLWGFADETALHALRLMGSGLFDRRPTLQIVLGHLGERIPFDLWRLDNRLRQVPERPFRRTMGDYFRENFHLATSGHFSTPSLIQAIMTVGADRIMFAVDYPFEDHMQGARWFDTADISENDRRKIGRDNAIRLFGLG